MFVLFAKPFVSLVSKFSVTTVNIWIYMERHFKRKVSLFQFIWSSLLNYRKLRVWHFIYSHVLSLSHSFGESLNFPFDMLKSYFSLFSSFSLVPVFLYVFFVSLKSVMSPYFFFCPCQLCMSHITSGFILINPCLVCVMFSLRSYSSWFVLAVFPAVSTSLIPPPPRAFINVNVKIQILIY